MDNAVFQLRVIEIERDYLASLERIGAERMRALNSLYAEIGADDNTQTASDDIPFDRPPRTSAETLDGKILDCIQTLGYTEEQLNRWCAKQFPEFRLGKDDWSEMPQERKLAVYATFKAKVDEKAVAAK